MVWKPHVTVAAIIERNQRFLLVEEETAEGLQFNQPAGNLEENEDLIAAVKRETQEETAWQFEPEYLIGIQLWRRHQTAPTYLRVCFSGTCHSFNPDQALDTGIVATHWMTRDEIAQQQQRLRSPLVLVCIDEYLNKSRYPLTLLHSFLNLNNV